MTLVDTATAVAATQVTVTTQPSGAVSGVAFTTQPVVQLRDSLSNAVAESGVTVTAYLYSGSGTLGGTKTAVTNASGVATFSNLSITGTGNLVVGFHALMSATQSSWSDDVEVDRSASYFEVATAGGVFGRASVSGSMVWRSQVSGAGPEWGHLHLGVGRMPVGFSSVGPDVDFGLVTVEYDLWHSVNNLTDDQDKCLRLSVFGASDYSQAAAQHIWSGGATVLISDPATSVVNGVMTAVGWNDVAHFTWLGATNGVTAIFGATATTKRRVKVVWKLNTPGQSDGYTKVYYDGVLDHEQTGRSYVGTYTSYGINGIFWENYREGGAGTANNRHYDNLTVTGQAYDAVNSNTISVSAGVGPDPILLEDFSTYTSAPNLLADPRGIWDNVEGFNTNRIALDTSVGYGASDRSMRYDWPDNGASCADYQIRPGNLIIPARKHIWVEYVVRFSANFDVEWGQSGCTGGLKLAAALDNGGSGGRWNIPQMHADYWELGWPDDVVDAGDLGVTISDLWDGTDQVFRCEMKLATSSNGILRFQPPGGTLYEKTNCDTLNHPDIGWFCPTLNLNAGPDIATMKMWWLKIAVYDSDPGWWP